MGWLFGSKKKVPKVPLPEGQVLDEKSLRFPSSFSDERVIEPDQIKQAVGVGETYSFSDMDSNPVTAPVQPRLRSASMSAPLSGVQTSKPLFVRVEVYQKILGEIDSLRDDLKELNHFNGSLENSEYN